jgi:cobalt-zinc-cadmium efflux system protein
VSDHHHGHGHEHGQHHGHHHSASGRLGLALALNLSFTLVELVGAWWTNSTAVAADAVHDLGDSLALAFAWRMEGLAARGADASYSFGYRRLSLLSALVSAVVLLAGGLVVLIEAVPRLLNPEPAHAEGMLGLAVLGLLVNGAAAWRVREGNTLNERMVSWHLIEDVLGWAAVLVASLAMLVWDVPMLDPLLAVGVTCFVAVQALRNLGSVVRLFLQATPADIDPGEVSRGLLAVPGVLGVQHLHIWSQDGDHHVATCAVEVALGSTLEEAVAVREAAREALRGLGIAHATLEVHPVGLNDQGCG